MKIQYVEITGMHNIAERARYDFNDLNYLFGPNGAGKSTVVQAIQLALLGFIPGYQKTNKAIMEHANGNRMIVSLKTDECFIERSYSKKGSTVKSDTRMDPEDADKMILNSLNGMESMVFNFDEFTSLSANNQKAWFLKYLPSSSLNIKLRDRLKRSLMNEDDGSCVITDDPDPYIDEILKQNPANLTIDTVSSLHADVKEQISATNGELKALQNTLNTLIFYEDVDVTNEDHVKQSIETCKNRQSELTNCLFDVRQLESLKNQYRRLLEEKHDSSEYCEKRLADLKKELELEESERAELADKVKMFTIDTSEYDALRDELAFQTKLAKGSGVCPYNKKRCEIAEGLVSDASKSLTGLSEKVSSSKAAIDKQQEALRALDNQLTNCDLTISSIKSQIGLTERELSEIVSWEDKKKSLESQIEEFRHLRSEEEYRADISNTEGLIEEYNQMLSKIEANKQFNKMQDSIQKDTLHADTKLTCLKQFEKVLGPNGVQKEIAEAPFQELEAKLTAALRTSFRRDDVTAFFNSQGGNNSFSFGLIRGSDTIPYGALSSGEQCVYMISLVGCLLSYTEGFNTLMVDGVFDHLDSENIKTVMKVVSDMSKNDGTQFILSGFAKLPSVYKRNTIDLSIKEAE